MTGQTRTQHRRTRPTPRLVLLVLLVCAVYGAGANVGTGTVLLLAAGMAVGTTWSVVGFVRRVDAVRVRFDDTYAAVEGRVLLPLHVTVPRGVIGVVRLVPTLPAAAASHLLLATTAHDGDVGAQWAPLPRSGTTARVPAATVLARGDAQQLHVELEMTDGLGLVRRRWRLPGPVVDVTPARGAAAAFDADTVEGTDDAWIAHALTANGAPATELRPWRPGEGVRAVHWAASERARELLVRPRGPETQQRRTLTVPERHWTREDLDTHCRDLTATADRLTRAGVAVEVQVAGRLVPWSDEARRLLAGIRPNASSISPSVDTTAPGHD